MKMSPYSNQEMTDMHFMYSRINRNASAVHRKV